MIVFGRYKNQPLFILPLAVLPFGPWRRLTWLASDLSDYNAPILDQNYQDKLPPERFPALWNDIVALLCSGLVDRIDFVEFQKMPETIGNIRNPFLSLPVALNANGAHLTSLGSSWEEFYARRSSATRRRDRTKLRKLASYGGISFIEPKEEKEIERTLNVLFEQKSRSLAQMGARNIFAFPGYREFFLEIATNLKLRDLIHISRLNIGATVGAVNLGLTFRGCFYHVLMSYEQGEIARFGPGTAHLRELLRRAIERGYSRFDFTIGDESYKKEWCDQELKLFDYMAATSWWGIPICFALVTWLRTKRFIKQTPVLWRSLSLIRSLVPKFKRERRNSSAS